ncbi:MAG: C69 family dipeptidase, partial [Gemmatimonadota bacterium]|nr:C69 family dipeptidase [Gemmatimonadota bacterium]
MRHLARLTILVLCLHLPFSVAASGAEQNCYSVVAGRYASSDGSVMLGHNEDNGIEMVARMRKVPGKTHAPGSMFELEGGGKIPQPAVTYAYWFHEMPGLGYSHCLLNEHGVAVVSDNCPSREDLFDLTDGGIGPALRILVAERCSTARQGARLVGSLVERFGYKASGRTLVICDSREGWLVAMVRGRHWVAARVPDNEVAFLANTYSIRHVDLADTLNFLGCADLVDYAVSRGWYDPAEGEKGRNGESEANGVNRVKNFDFEQAYADREARVSLDNVGRQWSGLRHVVAEKIPVPGKEVPLDEALLPFSVKPRTRLAAADFFNILRDHYEDTPYGPDPYQPHSYPRTFEAGVICNKGTNSGSVFVLRSGLPLEIGALWWLALQHPCSSPFIPLYLGLPEVPEQLYFEVDAGVYNDPGSAVQPPADKAYR